VNFEHLAPYGPSRLPYKGRTTRLIVGCAAATPGTRTWPGHDLPTREAAPDRGTGRFYNEKVDTL